MAARTKTSKDRPSYRCTECGWQTAKWLGRCPECQAWGTVEEYGPPAVRTTAPGRVTTSALPIGQVDGRQATARSTGVPELDRVLGGGLVPGAVVLVAGEPGVGKSTLLLDVAAKAASEERLLRFVADASHELRTPLTAVRGYADLYRAGGLADPAELDTAMTRIGTESRRMGALVDDLLLLARLDQGRPVRQDAVDLSRIAADAVADAHALEPARPIVGAIDPGG